MKTDIKKIQSCPATWDIGTRYADDGYDVTHGLSQGSDKCNCGIGQHYVDPKGDIYLSMWDR